MTKQTKAQLATRVNELTHMLSCALARASKAEQAAENWKRLHDMLQAKHFEGFDTVTGEYRVDQYHFV